MVNWEQINLKHYVALFFIVAFSWMNAQDTPAEAVSGDAANGEALFNQHCAICHKLEGASIGPALGGVIERLQTEQGLGVEWLHKWIRNNEELRASGDEYANQVFEEWNEVIMLPFEQLSDQEIDDILVYVETPPAAPTVAEATDVVATSDSDTSFPLGALIIAFGVLAVLLIWVLYRVNALMKLSAEEGGELLAQEDITFAERFEKNKKVAYAGMGILTLLVFYGLWSFMIGVGVDKGYQPEQPIYFSHKIHAGEQGIDCQYCHSSAKYGKVSGIPSTNLCMNCHFQIQDYTGEYVEEGKSRQFYTDEIQKIYASIGFDPETLTYTGEYDPIEWNRIHNLPDFVYFNHAQHVVAGEDAIMAAKGVEQVCFACHGNVNEMDEVKMANDFTMGWCIECHRETKVDMENEYNKEYYAQLHEKLKEQYGDNAEITVDAIGGLECAKCHY